MATIVFFFTCCAYPLSCHFSHSPVPLPFAGYSLSTKECMWSNRSILKNIFIPLSSSFQALGWCVEMTCGYQSFWLHNAALPFLDANNQQAMQRYWYCGWLSFHDADEPTCLTWQRQFITACAFVFFDFTFVMNEDNSLFWMQSRSTICKRVKYDWVGMNDPLKSASILLFLAMLCFTA
jgi:hypothetical protein